MGYKRTKVGPVLHDNKGGGVIMYTSEKEVGRNVVSSRCLI